MALAFVSVSLLFTSPLSVTSAAFGMFFLFIDILGIGWGSIRSLLNFLVRDISHNCYTERDQRPKRALQFATGEQAFKNTRLFLFRPIGVRILW
jgi:hypothetical protein